jgi:uncharacterized membrane protein (DUF4010 family)
MANRMASGAAGFEKVCTFVGAKDIIRMTVIVCRSGSETVNERRGTRDEMSATPFEAVSAVAFVILIVLILFLGVLGRIWG